MTNKINYKNMRLIVGIYNKKPKYWIWNKDLRFGEDTECEDLWNTGFEFGLKTILGFKFIEARARKCPKSTRN